MYFIEKGACTKSSEDFALNTQRNIVVNNG